MPFRYIPNLRWKRGERNALSNLSAAGKQNVSPLLLIGSDQFKDKKATKNTAEIPASVAIAQDISQVWGPTPFFLDASPIPDVPGGSHRLVEIANRCAALGLEVIPATSLGVSVSYQQAVQTVRAQQNCGAALRIDLQEMSSMAAWISAWPIPAQETDLLIDFGDQAAQVATLGGAVNIAFQNLHLGNQWRTVTAVGTSMPPNFTGFGQGLHILPRYEKQLWQQLVGFGLPYQLDYGDYATVSTASPPPGIAWGYPISVKYTLQDSFLICRGVRTKGVGAADPGVQLTGHAQSIVAYHARGALAHCWADKEIDAISTGKSPAGLEHWVRIGVNRHIELVRATLP